MVRVHEQVRDMRVTFDLSEALVKRRLGDEAVRRGTTMSSLVEAGIRRLVGTPRGAAGRPNLPPLPTWHGGAPLVDIADREALHRVMDGDRYGLETTPDAPDPSPESPETTK